MTIPELDVSRARRYLLGEATEEECASLEGEYFRDEDVVGHVAAAEDDLIEDYISNRLGPAERGRFERAYLSVPHRRRRVDTIRLLIAAASQPAALRTASTELPVQAFRLRWLALAATLILVGAGALWMAAPSRDEPGAVAGNQPPTALTSPNPTPAPPVPGQPTNSSPAASRVFAVSISPVSVRSASERPSVIVPEGTDLIALRLEGETHGRTLVPARAVIRTVTGDEIWQGPVTVDGNLPRGVVARLDVPAARLPVDDYVVTLFGTDAAGAEHERSRYFLRVRAP